MLRKIVLAGVPEQVNIPILLSLERNLFKSKGLDVEYRLVPEGTGKMLDLLESGDVDIALTVTDGFIAGKASGRKVNLAGTYVESPLTWCIAGKGSGEQKKIKDLKRFGISRMGSGSHTMAFYAAMLHNIDPASLEFTIANNFTGLRNGVNDDSFDAFLWEIFTTKPFIDNKELQLLGEVQTPWSSFSFVVPSSSSSDKQEEIKSKLFPALAEGVDLFIKEAEETHEKDGESSIQRISREHGHTDKDAKLWFSRCRYATHDQENRISSPFAVDFKATSMSLQILKRAGIVSPDFVIEDLWSDNKIITFKNL